MLIERKIVWIWIFAILLLFFGVMIRSGVIVDKSYLPRILTLSLLLLITFLVALRGKFHVEVSVFVILFVAFYLWNLLSCTWAVSFSEAIMQSQLVFLSLAVYLVVFSVISRSPVFELIFVKVLLFVLLFSFGLAFYRMHTLEFFDPYRILSVSANNNLYSGFLLLSLPLLFAGYTLMKGGWKYLAVISGILTLFFIVIIRSRATYLGLVTGILFASIFMIWRWKTAFSKRNVFTGTASVLLLTIILGMFYFTLDETGKSNFLTKVRIWNYLRSYDYATARTIIKLKTPRQASNVQLAAFDFAEDYQETANLRLIFWKKTFHLVKTYPLCGVGAGNWKIMIPSCPEPVNPEHTIKNYTYSQPHNEWIGILAELGIVGLIFAMLLFFLPVCFVFYRIFLHHQAVSFPAVFYASFITGFYLFCFFDFPLKRVEHNVLLFSMLGFMMHRVPLPAPRKTASRTISPWICSTLFVFMLILTLAVSVMRIRGEYYTLKVFLNERKDDHKVVEFTRAAESFFYRITPNNLPVAWFKGIAQYRLGNLPEALALFEQSLKSTPYEVRVLNDYAIALYGSKRTEEAKTILRYCIYLDPWFNDAKFNLSAIFFAAGRRDSSLFYLNQCLDSPKKNEFLNELKQK